MIYLELMVEKKQFASMKGNTLTIMRKTEITQFHRKNDRTFNSHNSEDIQISRTVQYIFDFEC